MKQQQKQTQQLILRRKAISMAVASVIPALLMVGNVYADCIAATPVSGSNPKPNFAGTTAAISVRCNEATSGNSIPSNSTVSGSGNLTVQANDTTTFVDTTAAGSFTTRATAGTGNTLLQLDGHGRTLTVEAGALIENFRNVAGTRTVVVMGANTVAATNTAAFNADSFTNSTSTTVTTSVVNNVTYTTIKLSSAAAPVASWVGQTLVMGRWDNPNSDFFPAGSYLITGFNIDPNTGVKTVTVLGQLPANFADATGADTTLPIRYSVTANYGQGTTLSTPIGQNVFYNDVIHNSGTIAARIQSSELDHTITTTAAAPFTSNVKAVTTSAAGSYLIDNKVGGLISASTAGMGGNVYATEANDNVSRLDILNAGTILAERIPSVSLKTVSATAAPTGLANGFAYTTPSNVTNVNALNTQEEPDEVNVYNLSTGVISSKGDYTGTLYMRADENNVTNYGLIEHLSRAGADAKAAAEAQGASQTAINTYANMTDAVKYGKGYAIGFMASSDTREATLTNGLGGVINGDILAVNGNALRWYLLSTLGTTTTTSGSTVSNLSQGLSDRLAINANIGQVDSTITNAGTINGNVWLSNGEHDFTNTATGVLTGNVDVDQNDTSSAAIVGAVSILADDDGPTNNTKGATSGFIFRGEKELDFENAGTFTGNLTLRNASSSYSGSYSGAFAGSVGDAATGISDADIKDSNGNVIGRIINGVIDGPSGQSLAVGTALSGTITGATISRTVSSDNRIENTGIFDGNITINDVANAKNVVLLTGDGFGRKADGSVNTDSGNITATTGTGSNTLNLYGTGTLRGDVTKFTTLNLGNVGNVPVVDDDDDDEGATDSGSPNWTIQAGKTAEFTGTANLNEGLLNVLGNLKANTIVGEAATLTGTGTITGNLTNNGLVDLVPRVVNASLQTTLHVTGNATFNADSILRTTITAAGYGQLAVTGTATFNDGALVKPVIQGAVVTSGQSFTVLTSSGITGAPEIASNGLLRWESSTVGNNLVLTADVQGTNISGASSGAASAVNALLSFDNPLGLQLQNLGSAAEVQKAAEQLRPEINGASMNATLRTTSQVEGVVDARISETHLAQATGLRGMSAGDGAVDSGVWLQGFGFAGQQDRINNVDGYKANGGGIAAGADTLLNDALRVGAAFSYANTTLDAQGSNIGNNNRINSYQGMLYASWLADGWYLNGIAGVGQHQFDSRRLVNIGGVIDNPKANYDAWQYFGKVELGLPIAVNSQFSVVPVASLAFSYFDQGAYTETSTNGAALSVQSNDSTSFRSGLGGKAFYNFTAGDIKTVLEGRAIWQHEFADTKQDTTASFAAGGSTFIAQGVAIKREAFNLGASLKFVNEDATQSLSLSYDADIRDKYVGHTGKVQARFDF